MTDAGGQESSRNWSFTVDTTTTLTLDSPGLVNRTPIILSGEAEAGAEVGLVVNSAPVEVLSAPDRFFSFSGVSLAPGQNTVTAIATDTLGNAASTTVVVELDESRPAGEVEVFPVAFSPIGGGPYLTTTFRIVNVQQPISGEDIQSWSLSIGDPAQPVRQWSGEGYPLDRLIWDGKNEAGQVVADGGYAYRLTLTATNGLTMASPAGLVVTVDTQRPLTPTITSPISPTTVRSKTGVIVRVSGTGEANSIVTVQSEAFTKTEKVDQNGNWALVLPLANGRNRLTAYVTDPADQRSPITGPVEVWLNPIPPLYTVAITPYVTTRGGQVSLAATARGVNSGQGPATVSVNVAVPGETVNLAEPLPTQTVTSTWQATWQVSAGAPDGLHELKFTAIDSSGAKGEGITALLIDITGPLKPHFKTLDQGEDWIGQAQVDVGGSASPLDQIRLYNSSDTLLASTIASDNGGIWRVDLTLPEGATSLYA